MSTTQDFTPTHTGISRHTFSAIFAPGGTPAPIRAGERVWLRQSAHCEDVFFVVAEAPAGWSPLTSGSPSFAEFAALAHIFSDVHPLPPSFAEVAALERIFSDVCPLSPPAPPAPAPATTAPALLAAAAGHMKARAATYDAPEGERSMGRAVSALNALLGRAALTESEGWLLLQLLKDARDRTRQTAHRDSLEDCVAYAALKAEARLSETKDAE